MKTLIKTFLLFIFVSYSAFAQEEQSKISKWKFRNISFNVSTITNHYFNKSFEGVMAHGKFNNATEYQNFIQPYDTSIYDRSYVSNLFSNGTHISLSVGFSSTGIEHTGKKETELLLGIAYNSYWSGFSFDTDNYNNGGIIFDTISFSNPTFCDTSLFFSEDISELSLRGTYLFKYRPKPRLVFHAGITLEAGISIGSDVSRMMHIDSYEIDWDYQEQEYYNDLLDSEYEWSGTYPFQAMFYKAIIPIGASYRLFDVLDVVLDIQGGISYQQQLSKNDFPVPDNNPWRFLFALGGGLKYWF